MTAHPSAVDAWVHPHQIEVQEFASYALVIDARDKLAFDEDHLPGAVSLPVNESARRAKRRPRALTALTTGLSRGDRVLVYCDRGGLDSAVWAEFLHAGGWSVDVLPGGWPNYRRWVGAGLEILPRALLFRVLRAPPFSGVERVLSALETDGQQVLDIAALAGRSAWNGLSLSAHAAVSQSAFESALVNALRFCDPERDVWVSEVLLNRADLLSIPDTLNRRLNSSSAVVVYTRLPLRVEAWKAALAEQGVDSNGELSRLSVVDSPPAGALIDRWRSLASTGAQDELLAAILREFVDCRYESLSSTIVLQPTKATLSIKTLNPLRGTAPATDPVLMRLFSEEPV